MRSLLERPFAVFSDIDALLIYRARPRTHRTWLDDWISRAAFDFGVRD